MAAQISTHERKTVPGLYFYGNSVIQKAKNVKPSDKLPPLSSEKNKPLTKNNFLGALTKFTTVYQNACERVNSGQDNQDGRYYIKSKYAIDPDALNIYFDNLVNAGLKY